MSSTAATCASYEPMGTHTWWTNEVYTPIQTALEINFFGNLFVYREVLARGDPYLVQLQELGYLFKGDGTNYAHPARFEDIMASACKQLDAFPPTETLRPAVIVMSGSAIGFLPFGSDMNGVHLLEGSAPPTAEWHASSVIVTPNNFVTMLCNGYFPIGGAGTAGTNQSLAEHDMAHVLGFLARPAWMAAMRNAFIRIGKLMAEREDVRRALEIFDSRYSLRVYYMIEVFTEVMPSRMEALEGLIGSDIFRAQSTADSNLNAVVLGLLRQKKPKELMRYLFHVYDKVFSCLQPLGGESRDVLNRSRKHMRSFYGEGSIKSKFEECSLYSLYLNGVDALTRSRPEHKDFDDHVLPIHAAFLTTIVGTSRITINDWVDASIEPDILADSKMRGYLTSAGVWGDRHVLWRAYCELGGACDGRIDT